MAQNWAIAVGINKYSNLQHLNYAKLDAMAMCDWLEKEGNFDRVFLFTDDSLEIPTSPPISTQPYGNLRRFLRVNFEQPLLKPGDNLWFFFAGHGRREAEKDYLGSFTCNLLSALRIQGKGNCATLERLKQYLILRIPQVNRKYEKILKILMRWRNRQQSYI